MDFKAFVDKAKETANTLAEQAKIATAAPAAPTPGGETTPAEQALVAADPENAVAAPAQGQAVALFTSERFAELKAIGTEKVQQLVVSFQQALPAIKSAGYELTEFEVELGVTPKLIPHFRHAPHNEQDVEAARETLKDNKLGAMMLSALLKAGEVHKQIRVAGFGFSHIEIELGLIPSVRLQYKNDAIGA